MSTSPDDLALIKRTLEREKRARKAAEQQLEAYSRKIYQTNESLKESVSRTNKRLSELEFLNLTSSLVSSDINTLDLVKLVTRRMAEFVGASSAAFYDTPSGNFTPEAESKPVWMRNHGWVKQPSLYQTLVENVNLAESLNIAQWIVTPVKLPLRGTSPEHLLVYRHFTIDKARTLFMALVFSNDQIDEETLYVLDTAFDHLKSGVRRRVGDDRVKRRNRRLQETITQLESTQQQLIQSEKMASLGLLSAGVAHEINNPVGYVKSNLEVLNNYHNELQLFFNEFKQVLNDKTIDTNTIKHKLNSMDIDFLLEDSQDIIHSNLEGMKRISEIVSGLKTYSHVGENNQSLVSIPKCIRAALKITKNELKYKHRIDNALTEDLPLIIGSSGQLQQVFINLFVNAAHAMPEGGALSIDAKVNENNDHLQVFISDTGEGMTEEQKNKLFLPFFTTKPVGKGTGLGLSVSFAILEAHNASIAVESDLGLGTTFTLTFPLP